MNLATGAMGSLLPKLLELLGDEYKLQKGVKEGVESLVKEMKSVHAALRVIGEVPRDQLDEQVKLWAGEVRELSFRLEDVVDKFLVRVDVDSEPATKSNKLKRLTEKMAGLFTKGKARHQIADAIKDINKQVQDVANRRGRYTVNSIVARPVPVTTIDPRIGALYTEVTEHVGIAGKRDHELMRLLSEEDNVSAKNLKIVSIVGFGGLGKTTLAKAVYDKIKGDFDCRAFVPIGQNANAKKILMEILLDLGMYESQFTILDERQLVNKLRERLENKRYLIVIDDIWDEKLWTIINWAFSKNNHFGSRLITTTRIVSVSKLCCSSSNDSIYQMEPLSDNDSKTLFYTRIFSNEGGCPHEFEKVSMDILKKCGGVPLAIITIAGLLASNQHVKPEYEWHAILQSIGRGLKEDPSVEEMQRILSLSYYDLPSHLKTCLLYLSMFPEDYKIRKDQLIWMWFAESFVQCGKTKSSLFEIGETYFNELVNRSLIQPVFDDGSMGKVEACRVHDLVLDLICSLSSEDNFVSISNGIGYDLSSQSNVRRLSLRITREEHQTTPLDFVVMTQVRSIALFGCGIAPMLSFSSYVVLRVLDLNGLRLRDGNSLNLGELGNLFHLRYLGLASTQTSKVPQEVGKLQFLQVLDLSGNRCIELPSTVTKLRRLMCLLIECSHVMLPDGLGNLTSLEVLSEIRCNSVSIMKSLGNMERLRELAVEFEEMSLELEEAFVKSLGKFSNIQSLKITCYGDFEETKDLLGECWVAPPSLQEFVTEGRVTFSTLPAWIRRNPSHMLQLFKLSFSVDELRQEDLDILGRLPALRSLSFRSRRGSKLILVSADGFHRLTSFHLISWYSAGQVVFLPGALSKTEEVYLKISLLAAKEEAVGSGGDYFGLSVRNLPSLREVEVRFDRSGVTVGEARRAEAALRKSLQAHPNRPKLSVNIEPYIPSGALDEDVYIRPEPTYICPV